MELEFIKLIDALPGLVWTAYLDGRAEFLNQRWCQFTGLTLKQASGFGWHAAIHPQDLALVLASWRSLESGKPNEFEARLRRHDGQYRQFLCSAAPVLDSSGRVVKWCGINTDIERVRALAPDHLVEAQRLSQTGSFTWDVLRDEHVWSEEMCRIFEIDPATKITSHTGRDMILPEDRPVFEAAMERGSAGRDELDFACRILTARGTVKHVHAVAHRLRQITDRPVFSGAVRDVTENKLAEDALNKVRAELTHVARTTALSALTASITHEVNQPLSGIVTNADTCLRMLASEPPNLDGARTTAQRMLRDANRAADVIQRLRTLFERKQPLSGPVDLSDAAREVLSLASSELQGIGVIVQTDFEENLPAVSGDRVQLQQVILNLVMNAADAMKTIDGRARKLLVATARDNSTRVRLSLRDSGVGIEPRDFEKLFDAFYTTKTQGMGVGLSISRSIIEGHRGRLWASANDGPGATFSFSLPCGVEVAPTGDS